MLITDEKIILENEDAGDVIEDVVDSLQKIRNRIAIYSDLFNLPLETVNPMVDIHSETFVLIADDLFKLNEELQKCTLRINELIKIA